MALYFFDSGALVKRYVREQGSVWVRETTASASGGLIHRSTMKMSITTFPLVVIRDQSITISGFHHVPRRRSCPVRGRCAMALHRRTRPLQPRQVSTGQGRPYLAPSAGL